MKGVSISLRLASWYAGSMLVGLTAFGVIMWFVLAGSMLSWKDRTLQMRAGRVEAALSTTAMYEQGVSAQAAVDKRLSELLGILPEGEWIQLADNGGRRIFPHVAIPAGTPALPFMPCPAPELRDRMVSHDRFRELCRPVAYAGRPAFLLVPSPLAEDRILLGNFTSGLYRLVPLLLLVSAVGGYGLSRRALRPVDLLIAEARSVTAMDLSRRLTVPEADDQLRRLATAWNDLLARIEAAMIRVTQFTADASHELRSPIAYIRTAAEFSMGDSTASSDSREVFRAIAEEAAVTGELLENLLTLARPETQMLPGDLESVDVSGATEDLVAHFRPLAARKGQMLQVVAPHPAPELFIHPLHLRRVLTALLDNAIKYTPEHGRISVCVEVSDGLTIRVVDDGIGIAQEHLHRVFDRFFRVDQVRSEVNEGVGLGLPIAKWLTERYGGRIRIESEPGRGTEVTVVFPSSMLLADTEISSYG